MQIEQVQDELYFAGFHVTVLFLSIPLSLLQEHLSIDIVVFILIIN